MKKYAKIINEETKEVSIASDKSFTEFGYIELEVEKAYTGRWYLAGKAPIAPDPTYAELRAAEYPDVTEQLDKLYHDIDGGIFGDAAKTSEFYLSRKKVKETYPKPLNKSI